MRDDIIAYPRDLMVATPQSPLADGSRDNSRHYLFFPDNPDVDNPCEREIIPQESPAEPRERFTIAIRERLKACSDWVWAVRDTSEPRQREMSIEASDSCDWKMMQPCTQGYNASRPMMFIAKLASQPSD